eukprot:7421686-Pyramimonas_sp.AAC.1
MYVASWRTQCGSAKRATQVTAIAEVTSKMSGRTPLAGWYQLPNIVVARDGASGHLSSSAPSSAQTHLCRYSPDWPNSPLRAPKTCPMNWTVLT